MAHPFTPDNLSSILQCLADWLDSLETCLDHIKGKKTSPTIATTGPYADSAETTKRPPFLSRQLPTKNKGKANAQASAPPKARLAKKKRSTKGPIPAAAIPLPLAQTFSMEGKADHHLITVVIPDNSAMHVIGKGGKGLKQVHNISDAQVHAYTLAMGSRDEHHISIQDTDLQVGDALVVLGKCVAQKQVHPSKMKKTKDTPSTCTHLPHSIFPKQLTMMLPLSPHPTCPSTSGLIEVPTMEEDSKFNTDSFDMAPIPSVQMASPLPPSTLIIPSVTVRSFPHHA